MNKKHKDFDLNFLKKTKIVATCGPSITYKLFSLADLEDPSKQEIVQKAKENLRQLFLNGVSTVRLNFSHGNQEEQAVRMILARSVANELNLPISIMLDTNGPEIRLNQISETDNTVKKDQIVKIYTNREIVGNATEFSVSDSSKKYNMAKDVSLGSIVLVDDGKLTLQVIEVAEDFSYIRAIAKNEHKIITKKRINLPNAKYSIPFLSQKDYNDITFGLKNKVDYIAASFVNSADDIYEIKAILKQYGMEHVQVIAKVETRHAIKNLDEIIDVSDGVMVARGDLGLEIPYYEVPYWEKYIIKACRFKNKRVIVATQMLDSLEKNVQPTRAEVTDVFFAVERGCDATMLSGETANGMYPIIAVETMKKINKQSELLFDYKRAITHYFPMTDVCKTAFGERVLDIAKKICPNREIENEDFSTHFLVHFTNNREEIFALSNAKLAASVIIVTDDQNVYTGHGVDYGVFTYKVDDLTKALSNYQLVAKKAILHYSELFEIKPDNKTNFVLLK
ncbi:pyruvate kinase [Mycoplasmoides gallisepticum]|uniref:Pyruvate kinase n=2 Tax=Mycoplasmoides gallisepticum TaxID=2096 RepID=Q7NB04_MYCGA|nr:pyruvate kinase [Mycoplasmoides gallisepticum]AAP56829.1 Pyruvate kinase [Mycoplasmoides gallisepticum str. R(low)]ADC30685.1 Pyruvate kinase [Mycoplasmoides gallisepticum str. R(high)]ADC31286.1 Pyruvate kinase [Mycoplasmoides gallisepticum str. F]QEX46011.1 pyruvate kinase [Mycoplasmoides gallisepticum]QEX47405.1 pyruvate kinase [Mycoplasmoides gallisepticum]